VRETAVAVALEYVAQHNALAITELVDPTCRSFEVGINNAIRPYQVLNAERLASYASSRLRSGHSTISRQ
jgi:hypothetical protein